VASSHRHVRFLEDRDPRRLADLITTILAHSRPSPSPQGGFSGAQKAADIVARVAAGM
jgi:hypothetical protein